MKTTDLIWNLVYVVIVAGYAFSPVNCKRQKPRYDEIERVINETHSIIWKCSSECPPGRGLSVPCGTSVPFSVVIDCVDCVRGFNYSNTHDYAQCKSCRNCPDENEETTGECTTTEDTTKCLGTCRKGFYREILTDSCRPCSNCCGESYKHHETQCENSDLPTTQQCRETKLKCQPPTNTSNGNPTHQAENSTHPDDTQSGTLLCLKIVGIVLICLIILVVVILILMWKVFGFREAKNILKNWCCHCCQSFANSSGGNIFYFAGEVFGEPDVESASTDKIGFLQSAPPVGKRPGFQRLCSVPAETETNKVTPEIPRSQSHPGCLKDLHKDPPETKPAAPEKSPRDHRRTKKFAKNRYMSVPLSDPEIPDIIVQNSGAEREEKSTDLSRLTLPAKDQSTSITGLHDHSTCSKINSVPDDFRKSLLMKKMTDIPIMFYKEICNKLDVLRQHFWDDYRLLGEKIGLSRDEIMLLGQKGNTTDSMMQKFNSQRNSSIGKFKGFLEEMKRDDVITIIDEWIVYEWNRSNSSSSV